MAATAVIVMGLPAAVPAASTPAKAPYTESTAEKEIFVPMRDGVHLSTDVLLPKGASGKLPTILVRTPYDKQTLEAKTLESVYKKFLNQGYLDVSSSNFPAFERNLNAGGNNYDETTWVVAENNIHHSSAQPSPVVLPILADRTQETDR